MTARNVSIVARKEFRGALRNRWFLLYTASFAGLALALAWLALVGTGQHGVAGFGRTSAALVNLVLMIVPLMALTIGAASLAGERELGTLEYLLAQPVERGEVLLGKYAGSALALLASLSLGFGASGLVIALRSDGADALAYASIVGLTVLLALAMLSVGMLVSVVSPRSGIAAGAAVFTWLALVFFSDLGLIGSAVAFRLEVGTLLQLALVNPLQVFKLAAISALDGSLDVLGPAGLYATRKLGGWLVASLVGVLALWAVVPLAAAAAAFSRRATP